jgi:hypothetical protein
LLKKLWHDWLLPWALVSNQTHLSPSVILPSEHQTLYSSIGHMRAWSHVTQLLFISNQFIHRPLHNIQSIHPSPIPTARHAPPATAPTCPHLQLRPLPRVRCSASSSCCSCSAARSARRHRQVLPVQGEASGLARKPLSLALLLWL